MSDLKGKIVAICTSKKKGTAKKEVESAELRVAHGIVGDAHAGKWHRQVSLLSAEKVRDFNANGGNAEIGAFGENLLVEGIDLSRLPVGATFTIGAAKLRLTQIGKECHSSCKIFKRVGDCIMPREGVFAEVLCGGRIKKGDEISVDFPKPDRAFTSAVVVVSDKGFCGEREDESGARAREILTKFGYEIAETLILPDEKEMIKKELIRLADRRQVELIVTSGGTGFSERDVTPEATLEVAEKNAHGISEFLRAKSLEITPKAMLSRGVSVIRKKSLIVNLPGSPKSVAETLGFLLPNIEHGLKVLRGTVADCAR